MTTTARCHRCLVVLLAVVVAGGCDLLDPNRPSSYPDTVMFGTLLDATPATQGAATHLVRLRLGVPRALARAESELGKPTPSFDNAVEATVTVTRGTVVVVDGLPAEVSQLQPGREIGVLPVAGTTRMAGDTVLVEAEHLLDFDSYRRWQLPGLELEGDAGLQPEAPDRIASVGVERNPVPVGDGRVLYFSARLRAPATPEGDWQGARRPGLEPPAAGETPRERPFRTVLGEDGWSAPTAVHFAGLEEALAVWPSWVDPEESLCLVTVVDSSGSWVGRAERAGQPGAWGPVARLEALGDAADAVYLAGSRTKMVFASARGGLAPDLYLHDPKVEGTPLPLEPRLNTISAETTPRVGPEGELYFLRAGRQLGLAGGGLLEVEVEGQHLAMVAGLNPTADGRHAFVVVPRFRAVEPDLEIMVAPRLAAGRLGRPVPVDLWRP